MDEELIRSGGERHPGLFLGTSRSVRMEHRKAWLKEPTACPRPHSGQRGTRPECSPSGSPEIQLPGEDGGEAAAPGVWTAGARVSRRQSLAAATVPGLQGGRGL
ncbi:uncharacterized protein LOC118894454 isoform X4 [Balaenoptera musculus]|uniref:Uncharacterized protein LOC118894454 isoform X4 n=1 Tax=Balaenoptera musculus TaxID=9771 RepID=A0A8B8XAF7_BALMU|nr:uncharacterized protein LOC118894454 isoform X4 [Balaenoptera musculus]